MRHILLVLLGLLVLAACSETTSPNLICTGTVEVDIHVTRFGADTVATCVVAPPDTVVVTDTVTVDDGDCDDDHGHGHGRHHRHGHHDHRGQR